MTVRRAIRTGKLLATKTKVGGIETYLIELEDLKAWNRRDSSFAPLKVQESARDHELKLLEVRLSATSQSLLEHAQVIENLLEQLKVKDQQLNALISSNNRLNEINAQVHLKTLPAPKRGFFERFKGGNG